MPYLICNIKLKFTSFCSNRFCIADMLHYRFFFSISNDFSIGVPYSFTFCFVSRSTFANFACVTKITITVLVPTFFSSSFSGSGFIFFTCTISPVLMALPSSDMSSTTFTYNTVIAMSTIRSMFPITTTFSASCFSLFILTAVIRCTVTICSVCSLPTTSDVTCSACTNNTAVTIFTITASIPLSGFQFKFLFLRKFSISLGTFSSLTTCTDFSICTTLSASATYTTFSTSATYTTFSANTTFTTFPAFSSNTSCASSTTFFAISNSSMGI